MSWILLVVAGLLEVGWAALLPETRGLTRPVPTAGFLVLLAGSMLLLAQASKAIPIGTSYAVWVGIGAVGAVIAGIALHGDPVNLARVGFVALLVVSVVGLEVAS